MLAYILTIPLAPLCLTIGVCITGFPVALLLFWTSIGFRTKLAGIIGGLGGVAVPVAFGYGVFRWVGGSGAYTLGPFLASTVPLVLPIYKDILCARQVAAARYELLATVAPRGFETVNEMADETQTAHGSSVVGEILGLVLAFAWFFSR
jgi:hypothetical protein